MNAHMYAESQLKQLHLSAHTPVHHALLSKVTIISNVKPLQAKL